MGKLESNRKQLKEKLMEYRTNKKFPTLNQEAVLHGKSNLQAKRKAVAAKMIPKKDEKFN